MERWFDGMPGCLKAGLWICSLASFTVGFRADVAADAVYGAASAVLIALVVTTPGAQRVLAWGPFPWLGRISYSLYLTHWVVMEVANHLLRGVLADMVLLPVLVAGSLLVAVGAHALIEAPAMRLGKLLTSARFASPFPRASDLGWRTGAAARDQQPDAANERNPSTPSPGARSAGEPKRRAA